MCFIKQPNNNINTGCSCQSTHHEICDVHTEKKTLISHTFPNTEGSVWTSENEKHRKNVEAFMLRLSCQEMVMSDRDF